MIPKSVSGTSLILALAAVLAWPVLGWAGEPERIGNGLECMIWADEKTGVHIEGKECRNFTDLSCYQRMREAMKAMNEVKNHAKMDYYGIQLSLTHIWLAEHWRPVMKDCVEGK
jgi:hypothetical protein